MSMSMTLDDFTHRLHTSVEVQALLETLTNAEVAGLVEDKLLVNATVLSETWDLLVEVIDRLRGTPRQERR
jgi:hypothetical protein